MASNSAWCLSLDEWKHKFAGWIAVPEPEARLNATIFFDFRPLYGVDALASDLRNWLLVHVAGCNVFLTGMAIEALQHEPPLGMFGRFRYDDAMHPGRLNLKTRGVRIFVDAARIFALAHGCPATNTAQRLRGIRANLGMPVDEMAGIIDAFYQIQRLRLRHQLDGGDPEAASLIDPKRLHELDRQILKEAFRAAGRLQYRLTIAYRQ
jgi:CBS domain-containing protein